MSEDEARVEWVADALIENFKTVVSEHAGESFEATKVSVPPRDIWLRMARCAIAAATAWQPIETAPRDHKIMVLGTWAGEIHGIDDEGTDIYIVKFSGRTDYPGFDWACQDTDAHAAWVKATHWMPLPEPLK